MNCFNNIFPIHPQILRPNTMEEYADMINTFVSIFVNLPKIARPEAIKQLLATLDSDEMDMVIEVIDTKIDDTANHSKLLHEKEDRTMEEEGSESGISNMSPNALICDKEIGKGFHSEYGEMEGVFYPSVQIEESSQSLKNSPMYQCPFPYCEFETKWTSYLKTHIKTIHEGKKFKCNQCDYEASKKVNLLKHISTVHGVDRYPCTKCDYKATQKANLQRHIDSVHEGIRYTCELCNYTATRKDHLSRHVKQSHNNS